MKIREEFNFWGEEKLRAYILKIICSFKQNIGIHGLKSAIIIIIITTTTKTTITKCN